MNPCAAVGGEAVEHVRITERFKLEFAVDPEFMEKLARIRSLLSTRYPKGLDFQTLFDILMTEYLGRHDPGERIRRREARGKITTNNPEKIVTPGRLLDSARVRGKDNAPERADDGIDTSAENRANPVNAAGKGRDEDRRREAGANCRKRRTPANRSRYIPQNIRDEIFERDGGRCTFVGPDGTRCESRWNLHVDHIFPYAKGGGHSPENLRVLCARHNNLEAERVFGEEHMKRYSRGK